MYMRSILASPRSLNGSQHPFVSMQRALRSLDDIFVSTAAASSSMPVKLDVHEDDKAFHVSADLPGLSEKEVEVTFDDGVLTLRGEKKVTRDEKQDTWHLVERSSGSFTRQLSLGAEINADAIEAKFDKGVLTVTLSKQEPEPTKTRKIEIKST